jgi:ribosome-associated protein
VADPDRGVVVGADAGRPSDAEAGVGGEAPSPRAPDAVLRVTARLAIPLDELQWRFTTSGGPGGQHANKASTRAEVRFDVASSPSLGPRQRARLLERVGPEIRVAVGEERSQVRNRQVALTRLAARLAEGLRVERPRRATVPSRAARARRLQDKRRQSERKRDRSFRDGDG